MLKYIDGGVCAAQGFRAAGIHVGVKTHAAWKKDVALIVSDVDCAAAAMFTTNVVKAAPIHVDRKHLADGKARAIVANSGNANACAPQGEENAIKMCAAAAKAIKETAEAAKDAAAEAKAEAEAAIDVIVADSELGEPPAKKPKNQ